MAAVLFHRIRADLVERVAVVLAALTNQMEQAARPILAVVVVRVAQAMEPAQ